MMRKTWCMIGMLGVLGLFTACGAAGRADDPAGGNVRTEQQSAADAQTSPPSPGKALATGADAQGETGELPAEFVAYVRGLAGGSMTVDLAEWVEVPGSRADELGITEDDAPNGFSVYNRKAEEQTVPLSDECRFTVLDWEGDFAEKEVSADEFAAILKGRGDMGLGIPYHLEAKDGAVVSVREQYLP